MTSSESSHTNVSSNVYDDPDLMLTDAVALQRAVISDCDAVPVSADVVAKIVAHYTSKTQVRDSPGDAFAITYTPPIPIGSDHSSEVTPSIASGPRSPRVQEDSLLLGSINYDNSMLTHQRHTVPVSTAEPLVTPFRGDDSELPPNTDDAYELLLRRYARLQGSTETLAEEAAEATRDRARLQAEIASLRMQLENARCSVNHETSDRAAVATPEVLAEAGTIATNSSPGQSRFSSESTQQLMDGVDQCEAHAAAEIIHMKAELARALAQAEQHREAAASANAEAAASVERAAASQAALLAARGEAHRMGEAAHQLEELVRRAEEEVIAVASARDWYQEQLHAMQEARSILQEELADARTQLAKQADELERQRAEASQARHELSLTQQRALAEKRLLARQLEHIEADILEREATVAANEHGGAMTATHKAELLALQQQLASSSIAPEALLELQDEVQRWRHAANAARIETDALDVQRVELAKQIDELRQKLALQQHETEAIQERLAEADSKLKSSAKKNVHLEASALKARQERSNMEVALQLALDEKAAFSIALDVLKANTAKVEANFKQLRQELIAKQLQCEELQNERSQLLSQLNNAAAAAVAAANGVRPTAQQQLQLPASVTEEPVIMSAAATFAATTPAVGVRVPSSSDFPDVNRSQEFHGDATESSSNGWQRRLSANVQNVHVSCERCQRATTEQQQQLTPQHFDELVSLRKSLEVANAKLQEAARDRVSLEQRCRNAESAAAEWRTRADCLAEATRAADRRLLSSTKVDLESRLVHLQERFEEGSVRESMSARFPLKNEAASPASRSDNHRHPTDSPADGVRLLETMDAAASNLRGRIAALQQQLDVHSSAVRSSSDNWRTIEEEIRELQRIVHGDRRQ